MSTRNRAPWLAAVTATALGSAVLLLGPAARAADAFTPDQKAAIEAIIKDYLVKNPAVLRAAVDEMLKHEEAAQQVAQETALRDAAQALGDASTGIVLGNPKGDVTLVEFSDYNCGFCKKALSDVRTLLKEDPNLRVIIRDLDFIGKAASREANLVALAARRQLAGEKLWDFHSRLMESPGRVNGQRAKAVARELGVDLAQLDKDAAAPEIVTVLADNEALARKLGVNGTPSFVIGNGVLPGAGVLDPIRDAIKAMRKCGQAVCS